MSLFSLPCLLGLGCHQVAVEGPSWPTVVVFSSNDTNDIPIASEEAHHAQPSLTLPNIGSISRVRFKTRGPFWNMDDACIQLILERKSAWPAHHQTRLIRLSTCESLYQGSRGCPQETSESTPLSATTCTASSGWPTETPCRQQQE